MAPDMVRGKKSDIQRATKKKELIAALEAAEVEKNWNDSSWGQEAYRPEEKGGTQRL